MPIINQIVKGGGTTPTGTLPITNNGTYDVTNYATASVAVSGGGPARYLELTVYNGKLQKNGGSIPDLTGVTYLDNAVFSYAYQNNTIPLGTTIDFSNISIFGGYSFMYEFYGSTNLTGKITLNATGNGYNALQYAFSGSGVTEVEINYFGSVGNLYDNAFSNCASLTKVTVGATTITVASYLAQNMFDGSAVNTLDVSAVETINGAASASATGHTRMFGCPNLTAVTWTKLNNIGRNALNSMFNGSGLTNMSFPAVTTSSFQHAQSLQGMLTGVANCTLHFPSNVQSTVEAQTGYSTTAPFGATSGTVLFDLPATE